MKKQEIIKRREDAKQEVRDLERELRVQNRQNLKRRKYQNLKSIIETGLEVWCYACPRGGTSIGDSLTMFGYEPQNARFIHTTPFEDRYMFRAIKSDIASIEAEGVSSYLELLAKKAINAKEELKHYHKNGTLKSVSLATALKVIEERGDKRRLFRKSTLKYRDANESLDAALKELGKVKRVYNGNTPRGSYMTIDYLQTLDVFVVQKDGVESFALFGEKKAAAEVIKAIRRVDNYSAPGGF